MDYFSTFRKRIVPAKVQPTSAMQLVKFHNCWDYIHNIFDSNDNKMNVHVQQTEIPDKLRQMVDMLVDEEARQEEDSTTGVCMEYFLKNGVLHYLVSVAEKTDYPVGIRGETIKMVANMVDLLDDRFLVHNAVHRPTVKLLRFCVLDQQYQYHEDLVDLMYIICSKIHGFPALLNIFFHHNPTGYDEFLLFTYLLRFVHREGRSGDYARTGLLFVMEMATADHLGDFILSSDFATIMAAGLGALYSQLPRKLVIKDDSLLTKSPSTYLLGQDFVRQLNSHNVDESCSSSFRYQLDAFLKLLEFCQDVLARCPRSDICKALLQYIRAIFLENILYPSILECSDVDGSSVAVISYIDVILQTVEHNALADMIVGFLIDDDDDSGHSSPTSEVMTDTDKICSNLFAGLELDRYKSSTYFTAAGRFTLKDLIFSRLKSSSQPAVIATLKLLKTLLTKHCRYSLKLLSIYPDYGDDFIYPNKQLHTQPPSSSASSNTITATTVSHHIREIELYFSLISAIDQVHADDIQLHGYEGYLYDMEAVMEGDDCFQRMCTGSSGDDDDKGNVLAGHSNNGRPRARRRHSFKYGNRFAATDQEQQQKHEFPPRTYTSHLSSLKKLTLFKHRIQPTDPLLQILLGLLSNFFAQSSELNLVLTGVISALATCPYRSLKGWISFRDSDRTSPEDVLVLNSDSDAINLKTTKKKGTASMDDDRIDPNDIYHHPSVIPPNIDNEDDDDRSIDYGVEKQSASVTQPTHFKSFPPFFTLFRTLTQQVDYYRSEIDNFDILLEERRLMLQNPNAAATLEMGYSSTPSSPTSPTAASASAGNTMGASLTAAAGYLFGFNNPTPPPPEPTYSRRPSILSQQSPTSPSSNDYYWWSARPDNNQSFSSSSSITEATLHSLISDPTSPISVHARRTQDIRIKPLFPSSFPQDNKDAILDLDDEDENTFAPADQDPSVQARRKKGVVTDIPLSMLLNNVVILEESIKELIAVMQVRSSLGVDQVRYV
ncbi:Retinoic acid induced 16-like protein-domain-containing protein [Phascolomyces articulosus]|uniref:Retinoic acid induced 16-like protein-domain-containing protein n=1 Tax=Phascolomyces articulosus TaxID=60185 RepID=A0AAD5K7P5_9FUNG|nr:Retinoic acid induced 16-like protein-domain-containing protein [Phascolomyces articulosus]